MNFRTKALIFQIFDNAPLGSLMHYLSQKYITKSLPREIHPISESSSVFCKHIIAFKEHFNSLEKAVYFEFGAGYDLYSNIVMYCYGIERQICVDIKPLAKPYLVNLIITHLNQEIPQGAVRRPNATLKPETFLEDLNKFYGIDYRGNADASCMELPDGSVDLVATTNTLEHIPYTKFKKHNVYNFLSFSEEEWTKFNPGIHYQNRLRHSEYKKLFLETGFQIVSESYEIPERGLEQVSNLKLDSHFQDYSIEDLAKTSGHFVLKK